MNSENGLVELSSKYAEELNQLSNKKFVCKRMRPAKGSSVPYMNKVYGDVVFVEKSLDEEILAKYPNFYNSYTESQINEFCDNPNFFSEDFKGSPGHDYGTISENIKNYNPANFKLKFYSTGKTDNDGIIKSLDDIYVFAKEDIDTSISAKFDNDNWFRIIDHVPVNKLIKYKDWIKKYIYGLEDKSAEVYTVETKIWVPENPEVQEFACISMTDKSKTLSNELDLISDKELKYYVTYMLETIVHENNFTGPASSSGKYHPQHELGEGGLIRHTKCVVKFAQEIMRGCHEYDNPERADEIIAACILHDMDKYNEKYLETTHSDHPLTMMNKILDFVDKYEASIKYQYKQKLYNIAKMVGSHSGRWTEVYNYENGTRKLVGNLPYPETKDQEVVHMADLMASRKWVHVNFDKNNNIIE